MHILSSSFKLFGLSFLFIAFFGTTSNAQTLSISSNGQTGKSGTNWSTTGSNPVIITATNTTDINTSVIEGYLNQGLSVEIRNTASPGKIQIEAPITKSAGGDATLTIRANGRVFVWNGDHITSTSGKLNVVLWSDYNNDGDGGVSLTGNIITNGGHVWLGGSSSNGGSYTWNGLTVGDGPSVGASGANFNALDLYSNVTTSGGDFLAWAGDGFSGGVDGIASDGAGDVVNTGSGDIILITDRVDGDGSTAIFFETKGHFYLVPNDGAFKETFDWNPTVRTDYIDFEGNWNYMAIRNPELHIGLTLGRYDGMTISAGTPVVQGNTSGVTITKPITTGGLMTIYGAPIAINANISTRGDFYAHSSTYIDQANDLSLTTNGGDVVFCAGGSGESYIRSVTITTNSGNVFKGVDYDAVDTRTWHGCTVGGGYAFSAGNAAIALRGNINTRLASDVTIGGEYVAGAGIVAKDLSSKGNLTVQTQGQVEITDSAQVQAAAEVTIQGRDVTVAGSVTAGQPVPTKQSIQKTQATEPTRVSITAQETVTLTETAMIQAQGNADSTAGQIRITAKDINTQGVLNTSGPVAGEVHLDALNTVQINGDISVDSTQGQGGLITAQAHTIHAQGDAALTATGKAGGGDILIGGDWQGGANEHRRVFDDPNALRQATIVTMDRGVLIDASVTQNGDGGTVVLWSDITNPNSVTSAHGTIYAKGGSQGGDGGQIETSGAKLITDGVSGSAAARNLAAGGKAGDWLFDPNNVTIGTTGDTASSYNGGTSSISASSIAGFLEYGTSVTVTTGINGDDLGELTVASAITKSSGDTDVTLTLSAANSIIISDDIENTGGSGALNLIFYADNDDLSSRDGAGIVILEANLSTAGGDVTFGGNSYVGGGATAITVTTGGGDVTVMGQLMVTNESEQGFAVSTAGGDIHLAGAVDSANAFRRYDATDWFDALDHAEAMTSITGVNRWLATIDSSIENSLAVRAAGYTDAWIGARRKDDTNLWQWVSDPAYDATTNPMTFFYQGTSTQTELGGGASGDGGTTADGYYANWKDWTDGQTSGEPGRVFFSFDNASSNPVAAYVDANGKWVSQSAIWTIRSYVQEIEKPASNLMLDAGAGAVNIDGAIGSAAALGVTDITGAAVTLSSSVALGSDKSLTVTNSGASSVAGAISGSGATVTKAGAGTLTLSGANSYTGATNIDAGVLKLGSAGSSDNTPLGTTAGATTIADGAALDLAGYTLANAEAITISGTGVSNSGAIYNSTGTAVTWSGATTLAANASIKSENGGALTWNGTINGAYALTIDTDGSSTDGAFTFLGGMSGSTPLTGLTITSGSANVTLNGAISIAGSISVYGGVITLDQNLTSILSEAAILLQASGNIGTTNSVKTIATNNGNISLIADADASGSGQLDLDYTYYEAGTGNILFRGETLSWVVGAPGVGPTISNTTGTFTLEPSDASFGQGVDVAWLNYPSTLTGYTLGKNTNTESINSNVALTVNGPITMYGLDISINQNLTTSEGGADALLKATGKVTLAASRTIQTNNGDIVLWSNSADGTAGGIDINNNAGLNAADGSTNQTTGGGRIVLGGGSVVDGNGLPTGPAVGNGSSMSGIHLGTPNQVTDIKIYSGGGNVSFNGSSNAAMGVQWDEIGLIDAGDGTISITGASTVNHAIELGAFGGNYTLRTAAGVTINGTTTSTGSHAGFQGGGSIVVTGAGVINMTGRADNSTYNGLVMSGDLLAASGAITLDGGSKGIWASSNTLTLGKKASTAVTSSTSDITLIGNVFTVSTGITADATGALVIEPFNNSFTNALSWPIANFNVASGLTGLRLGKSGNTADITLAAAQTIAGPITVYGGTITLDADLTTTTNSGDISLYTDNALGGLSATRNLTADGSLKYIPGGSSFAGPVTYPITNLNVTSNGLTIGKTSNTSDITLNTDLNLNTIALFGGTIALNHNIDCSSLEIEGTATLAKGKYIDTTGNLVNNGTLILDSDSNEFSRMMVGVTVSGSGTYKYQKYVAGSSTNDLITAPFSGETFSNLVGNNSGVLVTNTSPTTEYLFGPFDNDAGAYLIYDSMTNESTVLSAGQGYRAGTTSGATLEFTGTFETTDQTIAINVGTHGTYGKWNLVGNPFPSYLDLAGFISDNSAILEDVNNAVYAYDGNDSDGSNWTIYHSSNSSGVAIAPGQAFFVASSSGGGDLNFNTSRQTVTGGDDFLPRQAQTLDSSFKLNLQSNNALTHTDFYFNSNAGEGLDIGYDVGTYANLASSFSLYSKLASGAYSDTKFAIQTISNDLSETVIIPLGVHTSAGENHSISIEDVSLLESINVYLKDYETGTLTLLNNGAYSFSTDSNLEGISRFELRLTNTTLGIESDELVTNFKAVYQNDAVVLVGDFMLEDKVEIYDIMGLLTQTHTIKGNHSIEVFKDELATGVYFAKINREGNSKTIKFIIN